MNPWQPSAISCLNREASLSNEVEVLQTDVMRFFAILCLCLMAIFALVKTLPMAPGTGPSPPAEPQNIEADAAAVKNQVTALKATLAELRIQVRTAAANVVKSSAEAAEARNKEQETLTRLAQARQEMENLSESLQESRKALKDRELQLAEVAAELDNKQRIRSTLQTQIEAAIRHLNDLKAQQIPDRDNLNTFPEKHEPGVKIPSEEVLPLQSVRQGFTLRFASDAALQQLIDGRKVNFYALAGKNAWLLNLKSGQPVYLPSPFPRQIYEMQPPTVPVDYSDVFHRQVAAIPAATVTWGVTLPPQTELSIKRLIKGRDGGKLIITAAGEVVLN
jgi:hypothetical protein